MQSDKKAADYGESDIEAKAMREAPTRAPPSNAPDAPPKDVAIPASGTTEADIGENLREKASRESKS